MTRVLVVAPSPISRAGVASLLTTSPTIEVIGSVAAFNEYSGPDPDVIVADWNDGDDFTEFAEAAPSAALVILTADIGQAAIAEALRSGIRAVVARPSSSSQILAAVEAAAAGFIVLQPGDLDGLLVNPRHSNMADPLTPREIEVLAMLAEGQSNKAIAHRLGISEHTVKFHVTSIMGKLNAGSRTEAVTVGIRQGLIML